MHIGVVSMSTDPMSLLLYSSAPHPCSYLENMEAITAFVDPNADMSQSTYDQLINLGFRRSGVHVYMPYCQGCKSCISVRVPVNQFKLSRSFKRILKKNSDISVDMRPQEQIDPDEHYQLYHDYINTRHLDGDMYPANREQFNKFLFAKWCRVHFIELRLQGKLVGAAITDYMATGLSALYTYFDTNLDSRSLGTFAILSQIKLTIEKQLEFLYLGYYVKNSKKMTYKSKFKPLEGYQELGWQPMD
jgi:leucyl-tRNA---protein transferase